MKEKAIVESVTQHSQVETIPMNLKFQNGDLVTVNKHNTQFCRFKSNEETKGALVIANGHIYHGQLDNNNLTDTYICVRNRKTNKVRILPVESTLLNNTIYSKVDESIKAQQTKEELKNELIKKFGGRKAMRYINDSEKSKINVDMVKDNLDEMVNTTLMTNDSTEIIGTEHFNRIRPKFNENATVLSEIYNIYDVVPKQLLDRMEEEAKAISVTPVAKLPYILIFTY